MACPGRSSFAGTCASSRPSSLPVPRLAASSSSSAPTSVSLQHLYHQSHNAAATVRHSLLRWDTDKSSQRTSYPSITARQGHFETSKKNASQRGARDNRNANLAVKESKVGRKGDNSSGRSSNAYQHSSDPRMRSSSSKPRFQSNRSFSSRGNSSRRFDKEEFDGTALSFNARKSTFRPLNYSDDEEEDESEDDLGVNEVGDNAYGGEASVEQLIMPIPPAGFVLADDGSVSVMAPPHKRIATLVDPQTKLPLECLIRRVFSSSDGRRCFLLCPLDTPVQILKVGEGEVLKEVSDEELEDIFPTASFELAKQCLHLVESGLCLTLRGSFCFSEDDVIDLNTVYNESSDTILSEGVEVAGFAVDDSQYLIFTPLDPLMFVAYEDNQTGELQVADDDLMADEPVLDAIDDEKEFQAFMDGEIIVDTDSDEEK